MMYQKAWAMALLVGVNMPPMLMLIPPMFIVATSGWSQTALSVCVVNKCLARTCSVVSRRSPETLTDDRRL